MLKKVKYAVILCALALLAGCSGTAEKVTGAADATPSVAGDTAPSQSMATAGDTAPPQSTATAGVTDPGSTGAVSDNNAEVTDIENAVSKAILERNSSSYWAGECQGEGHYIMDSTADGTTVTAYVLAMYGEYGFEDGNLVKVSGSGVIPTVITFSLDKNGAYSLTNYQAPEDGSRYEPSIRQMFPEALQDQCLHISADRANDMQAQEREYASSYLDSIGRKAVIGDYGDFAHPLLTDLGVSVDVSNMMVANAKLSNFPFWVGNRERIEDGIRYVYQVDYDAEAHTIVYLKLEFDTKTVVEQLVYDATTGKELPQL
jgi:bla regulator protein BlaR1